MNNVDIKTPLVEFRDIHKRYGVGAAAFEALKGVNFRIDEGEFVAIMGPSGSGKSTTMNIIGALDRPTAGEYLFDGVHVEGLSRDQLAMLRRYHLGFVFQGFNLLARTTALENVAIGLRYRGVAKDEANERALAWLARVGLEKFPDRYPHELSGGMRKRVAMAQTLVTDPDIILMDESFSALDVQTRELMEDELLAIWQASKKAVLFITHDLDEAVSMSDRVVVMSAGPASRPIGDFGIDLPRPRNVAEIRMDQSFLERRAAIWSVLREEVLKSYREHRTELAAS